MSADEIIDKHKEKIKILSVCILIFSLGFACGYYYLSDAKSGAEVAIRDKSADCAALFEKKAEVAVVNDASGATGQNAKTQDAAGAVLSSPDVKAISSPKTAQGQFAGSKNSTLYHTPDCQYVKRVKVENLVYFSSAAEAQAAGKTAHSCVE